MQVAEGMNCNFERELIQITTHYPHGSHTVNNLLHIVNSATGITAKSEKLIFRIKSSLNCLKLCLQQDLSSETKQHGA